MRTGTVAVRVADTRNWGRLPTWRAGDGIGLPVVECFTCVETDTPLYEITVEAPTVWTYPWLAVIPIAASDGPIFEDTSHVGNQGQYDALSGARIQE